MNYNTQIDIERHVFGLVADGFSWDFIISDTCEAFGNDASEEDITDLVYCIKEEFD